MKTRERVIKCIIVVFCLVILQAIPAAYCEATSWDCTECGRAGNTGNYCGSCAHSAPWIVFGVNLTLDECNQRLQILRELAPTWTRETAPQTLDSFPFISESLLQYFNIAAEIQTSLNKQGSQYSLITSVGDLFSDLTPLEFFGQYIGQNGFETISVTQTDEHTFTFSLPDNIEIHHLGLQYEKIYDDGDIDEIVGIFYSFDNEKVNASNSLLIVNHGFAINWQTDDDAILIYIQESDRSVCDILLLYDLQSGNIRSFDDFNKQ